MYMYMKQQLEKYLCVRWSSKTFMIDRRCLSKKRYNIRHLPRKVAHVYSLFFKQGGSIHCIVSQKWRYFTRRTGKSLFFAYYICYMWANFCELNCRGLRARKYLPRKSFACMVYDGHCLHGREPLSGIVIIIFMSTIIILYLEKSFLLYSKKEFANNNYFHQFPSGSILLK